MDYLSNPQTIIAILSGLLLTASEVLPFISDIESNGIVHCLVNLRKIYMQQQNQQQNSSDEVESLIQHENQQHNNSNNSNNKHDILPLTIHLDQTPLHVNLEPIVEMFKLKKPDEFQLDHIIHYIKMNYQNRHMEIKNLFEINKKLLESKNYIVDYDHQDDIYVIKW